MTREDVILKLLATEPAVRAELVLDTGWGIQETNAVIDGLMRAGKVVPFPDHGNNRWASRRVCLPAIRESALQQGRAPRI